MEINNYDEIYLNPSGGGGGGGDAHVTTTQTNPVVPEGFQGLADMLRNLASGMGGSPVNFGTFPGLDRGLGSRALIPQPSMGNMFSSTPFNLGFNRQNAMGSGASQGRSNRSMGMPGRSVGDMFSQPFRKRERYPREANPMTPSVKPPYNPNQNEFATTSPIRFGSGNWPMPRIG